MSHFFHGLVLDLDGTLIDSAPDLHAATNLLLAEAGRPPLSLPAVTAMIGDGVATLIERAFAATGAPPAAADMPRLTRRFLDAYQDPAREHLTRAYPGVAETLDRLRAAGLRLAVCTNKIEAAAVAALREVGLADLLDAIVGSDTVPARKPDPAHVRAALDRIGVAPDRAAMVGDGPNDVAAARAAGLPVLLVSYGYGRAPVAALGADRVIERFADLPAALDTLGRARAGVRAVRPD